MTRKQVALRVQAKAAELGEEKYPNFRTVYRVLQPIIDAQELCDRFPVKLVDFERLFIDALRQVADKAKVNWDLVLKTDATPYQGDWDKLMLLVGRAMSLVEAQLATADRTILLIYIGLLARYDQMTLLERLRERIGRTDGITGLWLLTPGDQQAVIDGKAIPLLSPAQRARIPESWLENRHRAGANALG